MLYNYGENFHLQERILLNNRIPKVFDGAMEYAGDPDALEKAHGTFNELALYEAIASLAEGWYLASKRKPRILDLCSATGLCALHVAKRIPVEEVTLVDTDDVSLKKGASYFTGVCPVLTHCDDAVSFSTSDRFDIILMNSAYHHIEDERKVEFLRNAASLLDSDGIILVGEHFLPPYSDQSSYQESVVEFYTALITELEARNEPADAINVIRRSGLYSWQGDYEWKVSFPMFLEDVLEAGLVVQSTNCIWTGQTKSENIRVGSYCIEIVAERQIA